MEFLGLEYDENKKFIETQLKAMPRCVNKHINREDLKHQDCVVQNIHDIDHENLFDDIK